MEHIQLTLVDGNLHVEGFPDGVKIIRIGTRAIGRHLEDLALHIGDLSFARNSLDAIQEEPLSDHVRQACWRGAISHYFKCFLRNESRTSLAAEPIYANHPPEAMMNFIHFRHIRNKHLIHDENAYSQCNVAAIINDGTKPLKIEKIISTSVATETLDQPSFSNFYLLVSRALTWTINEFDKSCDVAAKELEDVPYTDLLAMPSLTMHAPGVETVSKPRNRG